MSMTDHGKKIASTGYLPSLVKIKHAIDNNLKDDRSAEQIVYLVDSNVIHGFANPELNALKHIIAFGSGTSEAKKSEKARIEAMLLATGLLTSEFIFSCMLPKQFNLPVFINPYHHEELKKQIEKIRRVKADIEDLRIKLERYASAMQDSITSSEQFIQQLLDATDQHDHYCLTQIFDAQFSAIERSINAWNRARNIDGDSGGLDSGNRAEFPIEFIWQVSRLWSHDLLRPLIRAPHVNSEICEPEAVEVSRWAKRLSGFYSSTHEIRSNSKNIQRDAQTIVQLNQLNKNALHKGLPVKYVLITDDEKIHDAMIYYSSELPIGHDLCIRRSTQYLPILNFQGMPNLISHSDITLEINEVIEELLSYGETDLSVRTMMYFQARQKLKEAERQRKEEATATGGDFDSSLYVRMNPIIEKRLDEVSDRYFRHFSTVNWRSVERDHFPKWQEMLRRAVPVNADLINTRFSQTQKGLEQLEKHLSQLQEEDQRVINDTVQSLQLDLLKKIERAHTNLSLQAIERFGASNKRTPSGMGGPLLCRVNSVFPDVPYKFPEDFEKLLTCKLMANGRKVSVKSFLNVDSQSSSSYIAAILFYWSQLFSGSQVFCEKALTSLLEGRYRRVLGGSFLGLAREAVSLGIDTDKVIEITQLYSIAGRMSLTCFELTSSVTQLAQYYEQGPWLRHRLDELHDLNEFLEHLCERQMFLFGKIRALEEAGLVCLMDATLRKKKEVEDAEESAKIRSIARKGLAKLYLAYRNFQSLDESADPDFYQQTNKIRDELEFTLVVNLTTSFLFQERVFKQNSGLNKKFLRQLYISLQETISKVQPVTGSLPDSLKIVPQLLRWQLSDEKDPFYLSEIIQRMRSIVDPGMETKSAGVDNQQSSYRTFLVQQMLITLEDELLALQSQHAQSVSSSTLIMS